MLAECNALHESLARTRLALDESEAYRTQQASLAAQASASRAALEDSRARAEADMKRLEVELDAGACACTFMHFNDKCLVGWLAAAPPMRRRDPL